MLKVTFLSGEFPPMQGGIADHTAYLAQHLAPLNMASSILISRRWMRYEDSTSLSRLAAPSSVRVFATLPNWGWRCWPATATFIKAYQPHILHIQYQAAAFDLSGWVNWLPWYLKKRGVSTLLVTTFHDLRVPYIFPKAGSFRWRSILALARYSDAVICTNREDLQTLQLAPRSPAPPLRLIPLGSNVEPRPPAQFERTAWRKKYRATDNTLLLAYFGFLNESKGGEELIESIAQLRQQGLNVQLLLIGGAVGHADSTNAAYAQRVQALIDRHNLNAVVHRTGYTDLPEVSANLLAADAVVMPYRDGVSFRRTTLIAALRHGCPVISTLPANPGLIPEIQPGENMLLVPRGNAAALAQAIAFLAANPALRQKLTRGAKQLGDLFEWGAIAGATSELYQELTIKQAKERK